jgi:UDP-glucuronate 4-epimerase
MNTMKRILITGVAGFIGSSLADSLLKDGYEVFGIDNFDPFYSVEIKHENIKAALKHPSFHFYEGDITDIDFVKGILLSNEIDTIVHLAAKAGVRPSLEDPISYQKDNALGTNCIFEAARLSRVFNIVVASSSSVYGNNKKIPFSEDDSVDRPISPYAATKKSTELMGSVYNKVYGLNLIFLRFFTVYGPRQRPDLAINHFLRNIVAEKPITLFGDGSSMRDYTYISDILNGIKSSMAYLTNHEKTYEIINIGSGHPIKLLEMVNIIAAEVAKKPNIVFMPMQPGDVDATYADISKARRLLGFEPSKTFPEGIKLFYEWWNHSNGGLHQ